MYLNIRKDVNNMSEVVTRVGISPFSARQHIGVYRSFLVNLLVAKKLSGKTFLRIDDTNPLLAKNISIDAIKSYLYGTITGYSDKIYLFFEEALEDFSIESVVPGQFKFDMKKLLSIQEALS